MTRTDLTKMIRGMAALVPAGRRVSANMHRLPVDLVRSYGPVERTQPHPHLVHVLPWERGESGGAFELTIYADLDLGDECAPDRVAREAA